MIEIHSVTECFHEESGDFIVIFIVLCKELDLLKGLFRVKIFGHVFFILFKHNVIFEMDDMDFSFRLNKLFDLFELEMIVAIGIFKK